MRRIGSGFFDCDFSIEGMVLCSAARSGWRYFSIMIRNPQKTPEGSSMDGQEANTFQIIMNTSYDETVASMSFKALPIKPWWVCSYTPWLVTTPCTADCGGGFRTKVRRKLHANPENFDFKRLRNCHENIEEHETCNTHECDLAALTKK